LEATTPPAEVRVPADVFSAPGKGCMMDAETLAALIWKG
jgi:hypothetical protein